MEIIYMTNVEKLKKIYAIDSNLEDAYILPIVLKCQDLIIQPLFCEKDYDKIIDEIANDSVSEQTAKILNYIEPIIAQYVLAESIYSTAFKSKNNPDYQENAKSLYTEINYLNGKYMADVKQYTTKLYKYLCKIGIAHKESGAKFGICIW